jgi:hypothetical protein
MTGSSSDSSLVSLGTYASIPFACLVESNGIFLWKKYYSGFSITDAYGVAFNPSASKAIVAAAIKISIWFNPVYILLDTSDGSVITHFGSSRVAYKIFPGSLLMDASD